MIVTLIFLVLLLITYHVGYWFGMQNVYYEQDKQRGRIDENTPFVEWFNLGRSRK